MKSFSVLVLACLVYNLQTIEGGDIDMCRFKDTGDKFCSLFGGHWLEPDSNVWQTRSMPTSPNTGPQNGADPTTISSPGDKFYLVANGLLNTQHCYSSRSTSMDPTTDTNVCVSFLYNMNGATMGSLYVIREHPISSNALPSSPKPQIDPLNLSDGDRKEVLVATGNQGDNWITTSMTIPLVSGKNFYRISFQVIVGDGPTSIVALDNVKASLGACPGHSTVVVPSSSTAQPVSTSQAAVQSSSPVVQSSSQPPVVESSSQAPVVQSSSQAPVVASSSQAPVVQSSSQAPAVESSSQAAPPLSSTVVQHATSSAIAPSPSSSVSAPMSSAIPSSGDGQWAQWSGFTTCQFQGVACGWGKQNKSRSCSDPAPTGGAQCLKVDGSMRGMDETVESDCYVACPDNVVDGGWGTWNILTNCSKECDAGMQTVKRECDFPSPSINGAHCQMENGSMGMVEMKDVPCNTQPCEPLDTFESWGPWSPCTKTCGFGEMTRTRQCTGICSVTKETRECSSGCRTYKCPDPSEYQFYCDFEDNMCITKFHSEPTKFVVGKSTPSPNTGADADATFPTGCGSFLYFDSSLFENGVLAGPSMIAPTGQQCISFDVNMYANDMNHMGNLTVYFFQQQFGAGYKQEVIWESSKDLTPTSKKWHKVNIDLFNIDNRNDYRILFKVQKPFGTFLSDVSIDNYVVKEGLCPESVDGYWSTWEDWGKCSETCGDGLQTRKRSCTFPYPRNEGKTCAGNPTEVRSCNDKACQAFGTWSAWSPWQECSVSCNNGTTSRERVCDTQGAVCLLLDGSSGIKEAQKMDCNMEPCDRDGGWGSWGPYQACSATCGTATKVRSRICDNPQPRQNGSFCKLDVPLENGIHVYDLVESEKTACTLPVCPTHGNWNSWVEGTCSVICGNGTKLRYRECNNPAPKDFGLKCANATGLNQTLYESENLTCSSCCPTNATWVDVMNITSCSKECGVGNWTWEQVCTNASCGGTHVLCGTPGAVRNVTKNCTTWLDEARQSCRLHGGWKVVNETECSCTSNQTKVVTRECIDPVPQGGGNWCENIDGSGNNDTEIFTKSCVSECHINGSWSGWVNTTICTSCGISDTTGVLNRTRYCNNPSALGNGTNCTDTERNVINQYYDYMYNVHCDDSSCPIPGNWSIWYNSSCDASCDTGYLTMERFCNDSAPVNDGDKCTNENGDRVLYESKSVTCNTHPCPQSGNWTEWTAWTVCDGTCGKDKNKTRSRECTNPPPENGGGACLKLKGGLGLNDTDSVSCGLPCCQQDAYWGNWSNWSGCDNAVPCTEGNRTRNRTCLQSECPNANVECPIFFQTFALNQTEIQNCTQECVVRDGNWTNWTDWSNCSVACGGTGTSMRTRNCTGIENGGKECVDLHNTTSMYENQTADCYYFCRTPEDCTFDDGYCSNFTMFETPNDEPRRWLLDTDLTSTANTGPAAPQQGTHYAYFESSYDVNSVPYYDDIKNDVDKTESFSMSNIPGKYLCIGFYYYSWADDLVDNVGGTMGFLKVTENNNVILNHDRVDQSWKLALYNTTASAPFTLTFEGQALTRYSDHAIDDLRFYEVDCGTYQSMYKPIPSN